MRYSNVSIINFTNIQNKTVQIYDMRETPSYQTLSTYKKLKGEDLDLIITKKDFYGDGNENLSYAIFEANQEIITENNFNLDNVPSLIIPVVQ